MKNAYMMLYQICHLLFGKKILELFSRKRIWLKKQKKIKEPESHELHYLCGNGDFHHSFKASFLQNVISTPAKHMEVV